MEPLGPLSPEVFEFDEATSLDVSLEKFSRSEIAGKLLDQLDKLYYNAEETEPFDWFMNEKSIDLQIFENFTLPTQNEANSSKTASYYNNFHLDSPEYESASGQQSYGFEVVPQTVLTNSPSSNVDVKIPLGKSGGRSAQFVEARTNTDLLKEETLTPPDSPRDDDIMKLLQEIAPSDWDKLVENSKVVEMKWNKPIETSGVTTTNVLSYSENSCSVDEFADYESSSLSITSESGLDDPDYEDKDFSPATSSSRNKKRDRKPYARPTVEERRQRKKEQNKNAATRYRMKKKQEVEEAKSEEKQLQERNKELKSQVDDISREIKYLKSLMRDLYRKKGLIK